ncbi:MAG: AAA family ATPase [Planctomycetaceae bacterium]
MPLVIISCSSRSLRKELAESLSRKLGHPCLSREELTDQATDEGIPMGKLEMSVMKGSYPTDRLARLKERYLAFIIKSICERARSGNLVYHGRGAHLLLPNVSHIFRVRLVPHMEHWIQNKMLRFHMDRNRAEQYVRQVSDDTTRWVRFVHERDVDDPKLYDLILNLENMSLSSATMAICSMAELPDFRPTPVSLRTMEDYFLGAQARLKLALDERTAEADLTVSANDGVLTVTYMPRQSRVAEFIPDVLAGIKGVKEFLVTMADTNILWIQETFDSRSEMFGQLNQVAQRWEAAVELLRFIASDDVRAVGVEEASPILPASLPVRGKFNGGIEDDIPAPPSVDDGGLGQTVEELIRHGRSGGSRILRGNFRDLASAISRNVNYSLVVLGDLFLSKSKAAQLRMIRDLKIFLGEKIHVPVISVEELREKYLFGYRQLLKLLLYLAVVLIVYWAVFVHQEPVLLFLQKHKGWNFLSTVAIGLFAPLVAYLLGTAVHLFLKMIKFD